MTSLLELAPDIQKELDVVAILRHVFGLLHLRVQAATVAATPAAATSATQQVPEAEAIKQLHSPTAKQRQAPEAEAVERNNGDNEH